METVCRDGIIGGTCLTSIDYIFPTDGVMILNTKSKVKSQRSQGLCLMECAVYRAMAVGGTSLIVFFIITLVSLSHMPG